MRTRAGCFFKGSLKIHFEKPPLSIEQQIELLKTRNLSFIDLPKAMRNLETIGYYRLKAYFNPFLANTTPTEYGFKSLTYFDNIMNLYDFDRKLRILVNDAIERIEIAFRAMISNVMSLRYGSHWYTDFQFFNRIDLHNAFLNDVSLHLKRSKEGFITDYYQTYRHPEHPPSWMVMECLSFGTISKLYGNIKDRKARMAIADGLGQFSEVIKSWMRSLTYTRNLCAHHARLWNRFFINKPQHVRLILPQNCNNNSPFLLQAYILIQLLNTITPAHDWEKKLFNLCAQHQDIPFAEMGFEPRWEDEKIWTF